MSKVLKWFAVIAVVYIGIALMTGPKRVSASSFTVMNVDDSGPGSLRQAILDANANPGADTINFKDELSGTITLTSGELLITDDLTINAPGIFAITVSGDHASRVFEVASGVTATISGLTISDGSASVGGGIFNRGTLTLTDTVLSGNSADVAGGILNELSSKLTITNSTLSGNSAEAGGGILNNGMLTLTSSTLSGNATTAPAGGGGIFNGGALTITNCTLSGNAGQAGGGIRVSQGVCNISFTTLSGNSASVSGGGILNNANVNIKNSIVANSTSGGDCSNLGGTFNATGKNFTTNGTCPGFTQVTSAQLNLGPLADNGGPTQTHALRPGSVAIDAVTDCNDLSAIPAPVTTDQRGKPRPADGAGNGSALCDAGAFELQPCSITCPANVTAIAAQTCPISSSATVTFPAPTASGDCFTITCVPSSGSSFPVGTTTVTCTTTAGNTAICSFTVTVFSGCLQDDSNPANVVLFNVATGEYRFCCGGTVFTGVGTVLVKGCIVTIPHYPADRRVLIKFDGGVSAGTASLQFPPGVTRCTITDRNTKNNTCACQ